MCLKNISDELVEKEIQVQKTINNHIDNLKHIKFNAGAGAGKTYALIESLKYIVKNHSKRLLYHNQNIICITYTNVATNEIKERLGNSTLVKVSTIHERLWSLIKDYQEQLVKIHKENLTEKLEELNNKLFHDKNEIKYKKFQELDATNQNNFKALMLDNQNIFYDNYDKSATIFKSSLNNILNDYISLSSNVGYFKKIVSTIYKIEKYNKCKKQIERNEVDFTKVIYTSKYNNDILHKMIISHDTLLEYGLKLIDRYDTLKQIIINKYPYILIDEYQDTDEKVVKIIHLLADYASTKEYKFFIGYFGDTAQNIYDTGIGHRINEIHPNLEDVDKIYNRRSTKQIIDVINTIRNDNIKQISIYKDKDCGSFTFYQGNEENITTFIESCKTEWDINETNKLHCLVLKNELVAKYNGFENIYKKFKDTKYYKKNWDSINTELLSNDFSKLGSIQILLYEVLKLKFYLENPKTSLSDLIKEDIYKLFNFGEMFELIELLKSISGITLKEYIKSIFNIYEETSIKGFKERIEEIFFKLNIYTYDGFISYLLDELYKDIDDDELETAKKNLELLLSINFDEYRVWFNFINKEETSDIIYHTYHSTKGEEYDNVVIIMQNSFYRKNKFLSFFENFSNSNNLEGIDLEKFSKTKNLIYVSCSRAIKNLKIFYIDDITNFKDNIENIFGDICEFPITKGKRE
jgi:DNA helicase-2/ATP-dependent DNA helicase PcrA